MTISKSSIFLLMFFVCVPMSLCNHYFVKDNGSTCIIMDTIITGFLHYPVVNSTRQLKFNITGSADGSCSGTQHMKISFNSNIGLVNSTLKIYFEQKDDSFQISNFTLAANFEKKLNATEKHYIYQMDEHAVLEFGSSGNEAYKCSKTVLSFGEGSTVTFRNIRLIAYTHLNTTEFPENQEYNICQFDVHTSDLVPIAVGVCLAVLVIIVLIAYLVGRARAKRQGYASV